MSAKFPRGGGSRTFFSSKSKCAASELTECTCAGKPSQEDRGLVPPEGVQIAWESNGTR